MSNPNQICFSEYYEDSGSSSLDITVNTDSEDIRPLHLYLTASYYTVQDTKNLIKLLQAAVKARESKTVSWK